jgi:hypothetical protein
LIRWDPKRKNGKKIVDEEKRAQSPDTETPGTPETPSSSDLEVKSLGDFEGFDETGREKVLLK